MKTLLACILLVAPYFYKKILRLLHLNPNRVRAVQWFIACDLLLFVLLTSLGFIRENLSLFMIGLAIGVPINILINSRLLRYKDLEDNALYPNHAARRSRLWKSMFFGLLFLCPLLWLGYGLFSDAILPIFFGWLLTAPLVPLILIIRYERKHGPLYIFKETAENETEIKGQKKGVVWKKILGLVFLVIITIVSIIGYNLYKYISQRTNLTLSKSVSQLAHRVSQLQTTGNLPPDQLLTLQEIIEVIQNEQTAAAGSLMVVNSLIKVLDDNRITHQESEDIQLFRDLLREKHGNLSLLEFTEFVQIHPEIMERYIKGKE